jgi:uncharacterized membrane protein
VLTIVLRFAHVFFGAIWVGMMAFQVFFLGPALTEAGPDAGKVMSALMKRRIPLIMPIIALIVIISGSWLLVRTSGGDMAAYMATTTGKTFAWGGALAIFAFLFGIIAMRPAMLRSMKLMQDMPTLPPEQRAAAQAEIQRLRQRGTVLGNVVTVMLLLTLGLMAVARYL